MIHHQNNQNKKQKNKIEVTYFELEISEDGDDIGWFWGWKMVANGGRSFGDWNPCQRVARKWLENSMKAGVGAGCVERRKREKREKLLWKLLGAKWTLGK